MRTMLIAMLGCTLALAGCGGDGPKQDAAQAVAPVADDAPAPADPPEGAAAQPAPVAHDRGEGQACMIAGEFRIMGQTIRSRDCLQAGADLPADTHRELCEGLAQTSAQFGQGEAGTLEYMTRCPSPAQGSCRGIFGQPTMVAFYYERSTDDLAGLPASCSMGGGTWEQGELAGVD